MTKGPKVSVLLANVKLVQKESIGHGIRDPGFNPHWGEHFITDFFCFHVVKFLMPILPMLPNSTA